MHWKNNYNNNTCKNTKYLRNGLNYSLKKPLLLPNSVLFLPNFGSIVFCSSSNLGLNQSIIFSPLRFKRYLLGLSGTFSILRLTSSVLNLQLCSGEKKGKGLAVRFLPSNSFFIYSMPKPIFWQRYAMRSCSFIIGNSSCIWFNSSCALYGVYFCLSCSMRVSTMDISCTFCFWYSSITRNWSLASSSGRINYALYRKLLAVLLAVLRFRRITPCNIGVWRCGGHQNLWHHVLIRISTFFRRMYLGNVPDYRVSSHHRHKEGRCLSLSFGFCICDTTNPIFFSIKVWLWFYKGPMGSPADYIFRPLSGFFFIAGLGAERLHK